MMNYSLGKGEHQNWVVSDVNFSEDSLGKSEAIMYLGNGYMGLRSTTEEPYLKEVRNCFVAGTFNKFDTSEVTELPNIADVTRIDIRLDGKRFSLEFGETKEYVKQLNLKTAELIRTFDWVSPQGKELRFHFRRFVSLENLHLIGMKMEVEALTHPVVISFESGINSQMTNSGAQHFHEGERRIFDKRFVQLIQTTTETKIDVVINTVHKVLVNGKELDKEPIMEMDRRKVWLHYETELQPNDTLTVEKLTTVHTSRDKEAGHEPYDLVQLREISLTNLRQAFVKGYETLFTESTAAWQTKVWDRNNFHIESENPFDLLALRFALYHLTIMTPAHDERMGIGAKAFSGEGYKGHSFWDTEIFILPFFTYSNPEIAKSLLKYRYHGLAGARRKAEENGFDGAMYPWEAAWPTDGEVTPVWGAVDIVTGEQTKIWSGFIEQHITADIAFAVWQYYQITNDQEFMEKHGYEMIFDTARFWASRLEWNEAKQEYHINCVVGPDEYKEHVDNNAFTNHMAHFNMKLAMEYYQELKENRPELFASLDRTLDLEKAYSLWTDKIGKIYLPQPRPEDLVIPQDDTYLSKKIIDLEKYKNQAKVGSLFRDYNLAQVNEMQVTKQADIMILFLLLENKFGPEVKQANFDYYEPKTLHDSSLSLSTHSILANDLGHEEMAYSLFKRATEIDLGPLMHTSDQGVHAASIGGIWQSVVLGFGGVRMLDGKLRINPRLPKHWRELRFSINWHGSPLHVEITGDTLTIKSETKDHVVVEVFGQSYQFVEEVIININK
ncbi:glycoside hydrolase family 65 protein [Neobacillus vireti]|uniref:Sugar hydrolase/phosphorylase n=1 Tax=Neobacillus vireti LMG 21834 TaxID=1131730 RepID=A0AB94ISU3_9BACI|nr:glycosyl hydrolase family 65 protein [Neobacillus vireti]ETI70180.1 Sugar hydrolase/phosphorylase [Neobacillus vireti LMG 21834]KLT16454.1 trehalase [Neobacillus vireti]